MTLQLHSVVLNASDLARAKAFWSAVLGAEPKAGDTDQDDWVTMSLPGGGAHLALQPGTVTAVDRDQPIHLDLRADDRRAEVDRVVALGAEEQKDWPYPDDADYTVLRDPDGHLFCIVD